MLTRIGIGGFMKICRAQRLSVITKGRAMSHVVDAWAQPAELSLFEGVPEVKRLLKVSSTPIEELTSQIGPKELVALMDMAGVSKVLLSAWVRPGLVPLSNEQVSKYTTAFPDRFVGIGSVDITKPMKALDEVERCVSEYGFKGIRLLPWLWNLPPTTNLFYPIFVKCVQLDVPFCTQVGHTGPLCPSEPGRPIPYIDQVALHFPELKIVGGHIGYPWTDEMIAVAWKHENVYIDTSAHSPKYYPPELIHFMKTYGADKVLFGTNFPQLMWNKCVEQANELPVSDEVKEKFLWKNANKVFKLGMKED